MKKVLLYLLLIISAHSYTQITFEKGYFIRNTDEKKDCFIKNIDWKNNPTEIEYKESETGASKIVTIKNIKEFGVDNYSKYKRFTVAIDRSSKVLENISNERKPNFIQETLFLKALAEGKATLFQYIDGNLKRYFFSIANKPVEQLVFKTYQTSNDRIGRNDYFKQQILNNLKCSDISLTKIEQLNYKKKELIKIFSEFNQCENSNSINFEENNKKDLFNLYLKLGLSSSSLSIRNSHTRSGKITFDNKLGFRVGIEAEYIFPFNKNKWGIIIDPAYQYYKVTKTTKANYVSGGELITFVDYKSVEVPIGIRHYFYLNDRSKLFVNATYTFDFTSNSFIDFKRNDGSQLNLLEVQTGNNFSFGMGFNYNKKVSLELRVQAARNISNSYLYWNSKYKTVSFIVGYNLF